jgi:LacI family transcriptional regulator
VTFQGKRFYEQEGDFLRAALARGDAADFVLVPGEHAALAALRIIRETGREPGADVLLAACADAHLLRLSEPAITAIGLFPRRLGAACAEALIGHLDDNDELAPLTLLPPELRQRASTASLTPRAVS